MKKVTMLIAAASAALLALGVNASEPTPSPNLKSNSSEPVAGLAWRCGKNNPAMWGTFGNGCLKQKRNWGKQTSDVGELKGIGTSP